MGGDGVRKGRQEREGRWNKGIRGEERKKGESGGRWCRSGVVCCREGVRTVVNDEIAVS